MWPSISTNWLTVSRNVTLTLTTKVSDPIETFTDWERVQSLSSNFLSPRLEINSRVEADKAARAFTASSASAYRLTTSRITLWKLNNDLLGLHRLLKYKKRSVDPPSGAQSDIWRENANVIHSYNLLSLSGPSPAELMTSYCLIWDSPNLEGQVPVFISPRNTVAQWYPPGTGFPRLAGLRCRYSSSTRFTQTLPLPWLHL
jgi:hypothetical protein